MATNQTFVDYVLEQIDSTGTITAKKMFGEYGLFCDKKIFALICNNQLFIKPTNAGRAFIGNPIEAPPYTGAKPSFLIEEASLDNRDWLSELVMVTVAELPAPKPRKKKKKMGP